MESSCSTPCRRPRACLPAGRRRTAKRLHQAFQAQGRSSPWDEEQDADTGDSEPLRIDQPGLFACYEAAAQGIAVSGERTGQTVLRLVAGDGADDAASSKPIPDKPAAEALGVNRSGRVQQAARVNGGRRSASPCESKRRRR
jgi:hypothetical protein